MSVINESVITTIPSQIFTVIMMTKMWNLVSVTLWLSVHWVFVTSLWNHNDRFYITRHKSSRKINCACNVTQNDILTTQWRRNNPISMLLYGNIVSKNCNGLRVWCFNTSVTFGWMLILNTVRGLYISNLN